MNDKYVTIKETDYEELIAGYCQYNTNKARVNNLNNKIEIIENKINSLDDIRKYVFFKGKLDKNISELINEQNQLELLKYELDKGCPCCLHHVEIRNKFPARFVDTVKQDSPT